MIPDRNLKGYAREMAMEGFAGELRALSNTIGFKVSSRGWCYILEEKAGLLKGDFDRAQKVINECRKIGLLPVGFTADDGARATKHVESISPWNGDETEEFAAYLVNNALDNNVRGWRPVSFWENQEYYVEVAVEKIDLVTLFEPVCRASHVPITNFRGWSDINSRAAMMNRFEAHTEAGRQCVLLYCGDHDPGGLNISKSIRANMDQLAEADGVDWYPDEIEIVRFGLNYDFIEENNLSWISNLETASGARLDSPRHKDHRKPYVQNYLAKYGARKVEANALVTRPDAGRQLMSDTLEKYIDEDASDEFDYRMSSLREELEEHIVEMMQEKFGDVEA